MKDTILTARRKKTEIRALLICFVLANLLNLCAILIYNTSIIELLTSIGYVVVVTFLFYAIWTLLRILYYTFNKLFKKQSNSW